jgi:hypothetical protein
MYISITGLKPKGFFGFFKFWMLAIPTFSQAKIAEGNLHSEVKKMHGYQCTLTAWKSRELMMQFLRSGAHLKAMKAFSSIATGKSYGYESEMVPDWENAFTMLLEKGKNH